MAYLWTILMPVITMKWPSHKKILCNMKDYAICVVKLVWEKADED